MSSKKNWLEKSRKIWMVLFGALFVLSIDFWNWDSSSTIFGFLPVWVLRIILLQIVLSFTILLFSRYYWGD